jgi:hypothetical protein
MTASIMTPHVAKLEHVFHHRPIARLDELRRALDVSGRTVFRVLGRIGYFSSYSHAGQYYTLARTPVFDADGLWAHAGVRFSRHRTLRQTVVHLVNTAPTGQTHAELQDRLHLRVYDTLADLVAARAIGRAEMARLYLYVSTEPSTAEGQIAERQRVMAAPPPLVSLWPDPAVVIEVLLAVIQAPTPEVAAVAALLRAQGKAITREQVEAVWAQYDLGKKTPASPRSRR